MRDPFPLALSEHAVDVLSEREISLEWVEDVIRAPQRTETHTDRTRHYLAEVPEHGNRVLRVVTSTDRFGPMLVVTAFFDRRMKGRL